jgi:RNA polymerase sigma factor (sigma-70 family)
MPTAVRLDGRSIFRCFIATGRHADPTNLSDMNVTPRISAALLRTQTDARLVELIAAGHERAFEAVVDRYERPLRRYCQRMLSEGLAEDVVQQAFLTAWSQLRNGREIRELRPWLYRVAHNAALNTIKRAGYQYEQLDDTVPSADAPDAVLERSDAMRSTINALKELPDRQREALVRTAIDGESRTVVALDLGLSDGAVGQLLHRARSTLRSAATAITPFPLLTWLAGRHGLASPHLVGIGGGKATGAAGAGATGAGASAGGAAGTVTAGGVVGSVSSGAGMGFAGIAAKAAAVLAVGAIAGVAP